MAIDFSKLLAAEKAKVIPPQVTQQQIVVPPSPSTPLPPKEEKKESVAVSSPAPVVPSNAIQPGSNVQLNTQQEAGAVVDYPGLYELREKILNLDKALLSNHPAMDSLLQTIHRNLQKDPELIHMLKPEERASIFQGLQKKTQTKIVSETVKSASSGKNKGLKNIGLEDLM